MNPRQMIELGRRGGVSGLIKSALTLRPTLDGERWITISGGPDEYGDKKYRRILIDDDGTIRGGSVPRSAQGKNIRGWWKNDENPKAETPKAETPEAETPKAETPGFKPVSKVERRNMVEFALKSGRAKHREFVREKMAETEKNNPEAWQRGVEAFRKEFSEKHTVLTTTPNPEGNKINPLSYKWELDDEGKSTKGSFFPEKGQRQPFDIRIEKGGTWHLSYSPGPGNREIRAEGEGGEAEAFQHMPSFAEQAFGGTAFGPGVGGVSYEFRTGKARKAESLPPGAHINNTTAALEARKQVEASRTYLDVPFAEKDKAKKAGARWDSEKRSWYAPPGDVPVELEQWRRK